MAEHHRKIRIATNPHRSNPNSSQPHKGAMKGSHHMAKAAAKRKASGAKKNAHHRKAKSNPHHRRRGSRNPMHQMIGSPTQVIKAGVAGLASAVATRQLPQLLLSANNTGIMGYGANIVTALVSTWAAGAFFGPAAGTGALIGGIVIVLDRILSETVSPISSYLSLSGVGDATAYSKLGTIRSGFYTHPGLQNPDGSLYVPDPYTAAAVAQVVAQYPQVAAVLPPAATGGKMGAVNPSSLRRHTANGMLLSSRFQGRFNQAA